MSLRERFMSKVELIPFHECWEWAAMVNKTLLPYGRFYVKGRLELAHRVSHELFIGPIPEGHLVLHSCDNASCVNPHHLKAGTQSENILDCYAKGRGTGRSARRVR